MMSMALAKYKVYDNVDVTTCISVSTNEKSMRIEKKKK